MLTVAVTGPTGEIGKPFISALEQSEQVERIVGMARRPFDPAEHGWEKVEYRQGDVLDREAVDHLAIGADVIVHLAFVIVAGQGESREINLAGSRNVFDAAVAANAKRLVYTSSVAAYGFDPSLPALLTEDVEAVGAERHPYSAQKAEVEAELAEALVGSKTMAYVFRPCIVAGPQAPLLVDSVPMSGLAGRLPSPARSILRRLPLLRPVLPDPGVPFQLVHHDDVATALCAAVLGKGKPGVYNLAGDGAVTITDLAHALGWHAIPAPKQAVGVTAEMVARLPLMPDQASWIEALRRPVLMDSARARRDLGWRPEHDARQTLRETVAAFRDGERN